MYNHGHSHNEPWSHENLAARALQTPVHVYFDSTCHHPPTTALHSHIILRARACKIPNLQHF